VHYFFALLLLWRVPKDAGSFTVDAKLLVLRLVEAMLLPSSTFFLCLPLPPFGGTSLFSSFAEVHTPISDAIET
jgi:hypothetical protein